MKINPKLRIDAYYDLQAALNEALEKVNAQNGLLRSCLNCNIFNERLEICNKYNQRPPARVIAYGCPDWYDKDEIPY